MSSSKFTFRKTIANAFTAKTAEVHNNEFKSVAVRLTIFSKPK